MKKRLVALLAVLVLLVLSVATASAATPTAKLLSGSKNQTIKAGKTIYFRFQLDSKSYTKKGDAFRAKLNSYVIYDSEQIGAASWVWSGKQNYTLRAKIKKNAPAGKYTLKYVTYYRLKSSANWKKARTGSTKFTVKK